MTLCTRTRTYILASSPVPAHAPFDTFIMVSVMPPLAPRPSLHGGNSPRNWPFSVAFEREADDNVKDRNDKQLDLEVHGQLDDVHKLGDSLGRG